MIHWLYSQGYLQVSEESGLTFTDKGKQASASENWHRRQEESKIWDIPLATKKFIEVTGIAEEGENLKIVEYTFTYLPIGLGVEFFKSQGIPTMRGFGYDVEDVDAKGYGIAKPAEVSRFDPKQAYRARAAFRLYDDGWRLK